METGFFVMSDVQRVLDCHSTEAAKAMLNAKLEAFKEAHPRVHADNLLKVNSAISKARTKQQLAFAVTNFVLAHPSEGLKVI